MWRPTTCIIVNAVKELQCSRHRCRQLLISPITAHWTGALPRTYQKRSFTTFRKLSIISSSPACSKRSCIQQIGIQYLQTAVKPAVHPNVNLNVSDSEQLDLELLEKPIPNNRSVTETDPWLLRYQHVSFNQKKRPNRPQGITFNVGYMDTGADWHESKKAATPTVLAIPGQPGSHEDMLPIVEVFHDNYPGHRVIVINMPGYDFTKGLTAEDVEYCDNSSTDLADFVLQFIETLQLSRIDMVVTHSAGSVPLLILLATSNMIKSAMIVCTPSLHVPSRVSRPLWFIKWLVNTWNTPTGRSFLKWFLPKFNHIVGWLKTDDPYQLMTSAKFGAYSNFKLMSDLSTTICSKNKPIVYIASNNDKLVELNLSMDWASMIGVKQEMFETYNEQYVMVKSATSDNRQLYPKGIMLAKGGHYPQRKDEALPVLRKEALALMAYVLETNK